jgi:RimJ/RimL family protein N-acetyltransferase
LSAGTPAAVGATDVLEAATTYPTLSAVERPDGRVVARPGEAWTAVSADAAVALAERRGAPVLAHLEDHEVEERELLERAGFAVARREAVVAFDVRVALAALQSAEPPPGVDVRSAVDVDEAMLRRLDDELRQDVPGTVGWRSTPEAFRESTFADPAFDPRTYLVAVDCEFGALLGLVRIWMNRGGPRLGLVGVRRGHRRRGTALALLAHALRAVAANGADSVTAEHDETNRASRALALRLGARRVGTTLELVYESVEEVARAR